MSNDIKDEAKGLFEKIPDIAFDWYARLIPGFICAALIQMVYRFDIKLILDNFLFALLASYIIGHLIQPFSSGILQRMFPNLRGKKLALLLKAYAELVGFASCLFFCVFFVVFLLFDDLALHYSQPTCQHYVILSLCAIFFFLATKMRKKAFDRKQGDQNGTLPAATAAEEAKTVK